MLIWKLTLIALLCRELVLLALLKPYEFFQDKPERVSKISRGRHPQAGEHNRLCNRDFLDFLVNTPAIETFLFKYFPRIPQQSVLIDLCNVALYFDAKLGRCYILLQLQLKLGKEITAVLRRKP